MTTSGVLCALTTLHTKIYKWSVDRCSITITGNTAALLCHPYTSTHVILGDIHTRIWRISQNISRGTHLLELFSSTKYVHNELKDALCVL